MCLKFLIRGPPHYKQIVSIWWLAYSWDETAGLTDFLPNFTLGDLVGIFGLYIAQSSPWYSLSGNLNHKRGQEDGMLKTQLGSSLISSATSSLLPTSMKVHFLISTFLFITVFS
jgi:hypothetical protein